MRQLVFAVLVSGAMGTGLQAQTAADPAIEAVINDQFADFRSGDVIGAFDHASPFIRSLFGTAENFGSMVQSGYPSIWGASDVRFLDLKTEGGRTVQRLMVRDGAGAVQFFDYEMVMVDGLWRINGVFPVATDQIGV